MRFRLLLLALPISLLAVWFLVGTATVTPEQKELTVRPLPFAWALEDYAHPHSCGLLLGVEEERYDKKAAEVLSSAPMESSDGVAYQVVRAIGKKDGDFLRRILLNPNAERLKGFSLKKWLGVFDMPDDPVLLRIYRLGKVSLYVFKCPRPQQIFWSVLITPSQGKYFFDLAGQNDPLCEMVIALNRAIASNPSQFAPVKDLKGYQSFELPPVFGDGNCEHPSQLYFKGVRYVGKVYPLSGQEIKQLPTTNNPSVDAAVKFYARAWQTLDAGDIDGFAKALSAKDADIVRKADKTKLRDFFVGKYHPFRQVDYILYSDNVFWMFYQGHSGPYDRKWLFYDFVVRDNATKDFQLVRLFPFLDPLHSFIQWKDLSKVLIDKYINADQQSAR
jgi:hypothetical protein